MQKVILGIVIQARTGSSRLPNKILKKFYGDKTILDLLLENIKSNFSHIPIILATSLNQNDYIFEEVAKKYSINFFRGSENDVLNRFVDVGNKFGLTHIVRICSDNPFLNMLSIKSLIDSLDDIEIDYMSFSNHLGLPVIRTHLGLFAEIVSLRSLIEADKLQNDILYKEHVTNYIYSHPNSFNVILKPSPAIVYDRDDIRLTLDDLDDFENLSELYKKAYTKKEDLTFLVNLIDRNEDFRIKMINNIKKYSK
nr:hypothetical protein [uncultured Flavobacterium sp.]